MGSLEAMNAWNSFVVSGMMGMNVVQVIAEIGFYILGAIAFWKYIKNH